MAGTYYKYAEREADSYINWAEIGKNMSDMLANENKVREEKKAAIDQASREFGEILANAPQGESKLMNEWALKFGGDAQSARLMQDKLLKSGQLKLNDYLIMRQNVTDGTTNAFKLSTEYQEEFKTKWDRMKEDKSQDLEQFLMAEAEGFGNFTQTQLYINPTDGKVSVAYKEKGEDGVYRMSADPSKFTDINSLRNRIKGQFDKYDVNTNMETFVAGLGAEVSAYQVARATLGSTGLISETLDIMQRDTFPQRDALSIDPVKVKELYNKAVAGGYTKTQQQWLQDQKSLKGITTTFFEAETKALQSQLANPYNAASILTNALDICPSNKKLYTYTWDPKDAEENPEKILLTNKSDGSPLPKFSEQQEADALQYLRTDARLRYDKKEELKVTGQLERRDPPPKPQPQQWVDEAYRKSKEAETAAGAWNQLFTGTTAADKTAAANILLGTPKAIDQQLVGITFPGSGKVALQYANSANNRTISMIDKSGNPMSLANWAAIGVELHGVTDRNKAMRAGGGGSGYGNITEEDWKTVSAQREGATSGGEEKTAPVVNILPELFTIKSVKSSKSLQRILGSTFTVTDIGGYTGNDVKVTAPNGQQFTYNANLNKSEAAVAKQDLEQFIKDNSGKVKGSTIKGGTVRE